MNLLLHLRLAGILQILLALSHLPMARRFRWREELGALSLLNRQIFWVHTFFVCLVLVMMGLLSALGAHLLVQPSPLARAVSGGFAAFWAIRLLFQWCVYSPRLWRGHRFNTAMHLAFTALWVYLAWVYAVVYWGLGR